MYKYLIFLFVILLQGESWAIANQIPVKHITICDDGEEWPPYAYFKRDGETKTKDVVGVSVDIMNEIATSLGITIKIELIPWGQCLNEVKKGIRYQLAIDASFNTQRQEEYTMSDPVYTTSNAYFYSSKIYPNGLDIKSVDNIQNFRVCGMKGYNYTTYGLPPGSNNLEQTSTKFDSMTKKIKADRCDLFLEKIEIMQGYAAIGRNYLDDPEISWKEIPGMDKTNFHYLISKNLPYANDLAQSINTKIAEMKSSGKMRALLDKYKLP